MKKFLLLFSIFFIIPFLCFSDEVIENFFTQLRNIEKEVKVFKVESVEAKFKGEIVFSDASYTILKDLLIKLFQKEFPKNFKIDGYFRGKVSPESEKFSFDYLYIYLNTPVENIIFSQVKNDVKVLLPNLGIIIKDQRGSFENLNRQQASRREDLNINFLSDIFGTLISSENFIKGNLNFVKESQNANLKTYIYELPFPEGTIIVEIFDKFYTLSQIKIINKKENSELTFQYKLPEKEIVPSLYLPISINLKGERDNNKLILDFYEIKYNQLFFESDFSIKEMKLLEFIGAIYTKIIR